MIVCHCHGITDREIRASVQAGARTCADVADACGAGAGCGGCGSLVAELVHGERRRLSVLQREVGAGSRACLPSEPAQQSA